LSGRAAGRGGFAAAFATGLAAALALGGGVSADDRRARGGLDLREVSGFEQPMYAHGPNGAPGLLYVVEREGEIEVLRNGRRRGTFLNIKNLVGCCESERGLFSIAFAPWRKSRRFYVFFTDGQGDLRISEFKRNARNPLRAIRKSRRDLLDIRHRSAANHNGGQLQWGPDGKLYIATGDGGTGGGPAQSKSSLLGKILRINPLRRKGPGRYSTPKDNPYVGRNGANEIFARGLRNPWRFSFDRGRIVIGDVGEGQFEEVDYEQVRRADGANFGWNSYEGNSLQGPRLRGHDRPIHVYSHGSGRCAITGGYVVRDRDLPGLRGRYLYGDLCTGQIRSLKPKLNGARGDSATGLSVPGSLISFGTDARDNAYVVSNGSVYRIVR
jgi:glucose/arabinose dehydrogenase